jgi:predicted small metal-binding protein
MAKGFECERDGVVIRGEDDDELIANVQHHVADAHPDLVGKLSRDDVLTIAEA